PFATSAGLRVDADILDRAALRDTRGVRANGSSTGCGSRPCPTRERPSPTSGRPNEPGCTGPALGRIPWPHRNGPNSERGVRGPGDPLQDGLRRPPRYGRTGTGMDPVARHDSYVELGFDDARTPGRLVCGPSSLVDRAPRRILVGHDRAPRHRVPNQARSHPRTKRGSDAPGLAAGGEAEHRRELLPRGAGEDGDRLRVR